MRRLLPLMLLVACNCGKSAGKQDNATTAPPGSGEEKIAVPGSKGAPEVDPKMEADPSVLSEATKQRAQDPRFQLKPEEGKLTIGKAEAKAGAEASTTLGIAPGKGYHVSTEYQTKLWLEAPAGVKLTKTFFTAGGRNKSQGDAQTFSEQSVAFDVKATAEKSGAYEIKGVFQFGICENDACHPRTQPVTIQVAAN